MAKKVRIRRWMIWAALFAGLFLPQLLQIQQLRERRRELQKEIVQLEAENTQLRQQTKLLENDPLYVERIARKKLGVAREGEVIYRFDNEGSSSP